MSTTVKDWQFYSAEAVYLDTLGMCSSGYSEHEVEYGGKIYRLKNNEQYPNEEALNQAAQLLAVSPWVAMRFGVTTPPNFHLSKDRGKTHSHAQAGNIVIARTKYMMTRHVLLHELAHYVVYSTHKNGPVDSHGVEFRDTLEVLIRDHVGNGNAEYFHAVTEDAMGRN